MKKEKKEENIPAISSSQEAILREGGTLIRLENETQMAVAIQRPRDEVAILEDALKELEIYPSMAEEALYNKPVGKDASGKMKYAEGLSIRAAESLANRYGNTAYGGKIISIDDEGANIAATFLDYQSNTRSVFERRVSKTFKRRDGSMQVYSPDRFDIVIAANMSKVIREVILRRLPAGLKKEYENKVREMLNRGDINSRKKKMISNFKQFGISEKELEQLIEKAIPEMTHEDLNKLIGTFNALKEGDITKESLFGEQKSKEEAQKPALKVKETKELTSQKEAGKFDPICLEKCKKHDDVSECPIVHLEASRGMCKTYNELKGENNS